VVPFPPQSVLSCACFSDEKLTPSEDMYFDIVFMYLAFRLILLHKVNGRFKAFVILKKFHVVRLHCAVYYNEIKKNKYKAKTKSR